MKASELHKLFVYDPNTGVVFWARRTADQFPSGRKYSAERRAKSWNARHAGKPVGTDNGAGYLTTNISRKSYKVSRIAFALHNGRWPAGFIDHIDGDRKNNRADNIREATPEMNSRNRDVHRDAIPGVVWYKPSRKWRAQIWAKQKNHCLGYFDCWAEALLARKSGERNIWGGVR